MFANRRKKSACSAHKSPPCLISIKFAFKRESVSILCYDQCCKMLQISQIYPFKKFGITLPNQTFFYEICTIDLKFYTFWPNLIEENFSRNCKCKMYLV